MDLSTGTLRALVWEESRAAPAGDPAEGMQELRATSIQQKLKLTGLVTGDTLPASVQRVTSTRPQPRLG